MKSYVIPKSVNILFKKEEMPELSNRVYRILWLSISIINLKDQHFRTNVSNVVRVIESKNPENFKEFLEIIYRSKLRHFGKKHYGRRNRERWPFIYTTTPLNKRWWLQVWNLIKYNGDIEIIEVNK